MFFFSLRYLEYSHARQMEKLHCRFNSRGGIPRSASRWENKTGSLFHLRATFNISMDVKPSLPIAALSILQRRNSRGARFQLRANNELQLDSRSTLSSALILPPSCN